MPAPRALGTMIAVTLLTVPPACTDRPENVPAETSGVVVRDSAGIEIVENPAALARNVPVLELVEDLRIGAVEGDPDSQFYAVMDVAVGPTGEIFTVESDTREVRVFTPDGRPARRFGGEGDGPGEMSAQPLGVGTGPDGVLVTTRWRFHLFTLDGGHVRNVTQTLTGNARPDALAATPRGWLVANTFRPDPESVGGGETRDSLRLYAVDIGSETPGNPIISIPSRRKAFSPDGRASVQWMAEPAAVAIQPNGQVIAHEGGEEYRLLVYSEDGSAVREIRADVERIPLTPGDLDAELDRRLAEAPQPAMEIEADMMRSLGPPPSRPVLGRLLVSPGGRILVERADLAPIRGMTDGPQPMAWDVIAPDGRIEGRIETPAGVWLRDMDDAHVYGTLLDELDVEYIVRYRIGPPPASSRTP